MGLLGVVRVVSVVRSGVQQGEFPEAVRERSTGGRRLTELDGVRGLAAVAVMCSHWLAASSPTGGPVNRSVVSILFWLRRTPLGVTVAGNQMVILFFVLSGMVLALPRLTGRSVPYGRYLLTRGLRLYPAAWLAVIIALAVMLVTTGHTAAGSTPWFHRLMAAPTSSLNPLRLTVLLAPFDPSRIDAPLWSLQQELRVSLILPVLVLLVRRYSASFILLIAAALIVSGTAFSSAQASMAFTPVVVGSFLIGGLLAKHRQTLNDTLSSSPQRFRRLIAVLAVLTFWISLHFSDLLVIGRFLSNLLAAAGAAAFIVIAQSPDVRRRLRSRTAAHLGTISYSLYLIHMPVMILLLRLRPAGVAVIDVAPLGIILSLSLASLMHRYVEAPAIALGRRITRGQGAYRERPPVPAPSA
jgi:peptidoglycan/LPS O-acetylase OafA/YrhL